MVIPERTRRVHKIVVPFFLVKLGVIICALVTVFLVIMGIDYLHVLGSMGENKRLKGENFRLRQEVQLIRNKVDSMQLTIERVRNYAKKLQLLTGQSDRAGAELPFGQGGDGAGSGVGSGDRSPASPGKRGGHANLPIPVDQDASISPSSLRMPLTERVDKLQTVSLTTESSLSLLQEYMLARRAVLRATPTLLPIFGYISSPFGYRTHPLEGSYRMHAGVDIAAEPGTLVRAPADGLIIFSGMKEGYGKVIVIDHGYGISTLFAHNSKLFGNVGIKVKRGDIISAVGSTGLSTGPHLHYEIRKRGVPVNPVTFFTRSRF